MRTMRFALCVFLTALALPLAAQQSYVGRYDAYAGYAYFNSSSLSLGQNGFHMQVGMRARTWLSLGFDYSVATGDGSITPNLLTASLQQQLGAILAQLASAGKVPPGYNLVLPFHALTQNFAAGPQLAYRHWSATTLFIRPSIGAVHESATLHPGDPIAAAIAAQLAPSGNKQDWAAFYGFGGGVDLNFSKHFAVRVQADFVHEHLFSDLLKNGRNTVRVSIGPAVQFGRNIN